MRGREREFAEKLERLLSEYRDVAIPRRWAWLVTFSIGLLDSDKLNAGKSATTEAEHLTLCRMKFLEIREKIGVPSVVSPLYSLIAPRDRRN